MDSRDPFLGEFNNAVDVFHEISAKLEVQVVLLLLIVTYWQQNWEI